MQILIDGISFNLKKNGGVNRYFSEIIQRLGKYSNCNIDLVLYSHNFLEKNNLQNINVVNIKKFYNFPIINNLLSKKYWQSAKADIFHSTYYTRHPNDKIKQVVTVYDLIYEKFPELFKGKKNKLFKQQKAEAIKKADIIICISKNTKKDLLKYYQIPNKKIKVIYPGVNKIFKQLKTLQKQSILKKYNINKPYFLYLGPRGRYKNFWFMTDSYALWEKHNDFSIVCVGGNGFSSEEQAHINKFKLQDKIINLNNITDDELVLLYNCAYAFIYPSLYEGFGMPVLEAMACKTLVLASNCASIPEAGGKAVLYFHPKSKKEIIKALNLSLDTSLVNKLKQQGLERVKQFTWEKAASQTLLAYKSLKES